jgi:hypothetical protein
MQKGTIILLSLALAATAFARSQRSKPAWFRHLKGWQKLLGVVALVTALIILLNPEFLALGLLGDSAFFDMLALALSVQMLVSVQWAWQHLSGGFVRTVRWCGIPSPGFRYLMVISAVYITTAISAFQKLAHRISS